jgi:tetratricopeptide (TPR) repeat protein
MSVPEPGATGRAVVETGPSSPPVAGDPDVARLLDEYLTGVEAGRAPDREALLARRPDLAAEIAVCLDGLDFLQRAAPPSAVAAETAPGATLGDFRLGKEIGRGGMGVVYEADQISLGRRVALKVLPFAAVLDARRLQRFRNEAMAAANLHHPHIVPVHAVGSERGVHYYAMQLIDGRTVEDVIAELRAARGGEPAREGRPASGTPLSADGTNESAAYCRNVARLGADAADALRHAHQQGVVHRDVKPANLMLDAAGVVWVTDFGLATIQTGATALTRTGDLIGTLRYMSPELAAAGRLPVDHRTDVYSLGATLYELLTLRPPVPGEEAGEVLRALSHDVPVSPRRLNRSIPPELETIVEKAMSKDAAQRYATAGEMAEDLARFVEDRPILARRPSLAARSRMWARRHRGLVAAAAVVLVVATAALAAGAVRLAAEERKTRSALDDARRSLAETRRAVDAFLVASGLEGLHEQPEPSGGQRALLESALSFYERDPAAFADPATRKRRLSVLHALRRWEEADAIHARVLEGDPKDVNALVERGHMLWHLGKNEEARRHLRRAIELDPNSENAYSYLANVLDDPVEALAAIDAAIRIQPGEPSNHVNRANALHNLRRFDDAIAACREAIRIVPDYYGAYTGLGQAYMAMRRYRDAFDAYDEAVNLRRDISIGHHGRANALLDLGRLDEALASVERALKLEPTRAGAWTSKGNVLGTMGRFPESLAAHRKAIELEPKAAVLRVDYARALADSGDAAAAKEQLDVALRLDDRDALAHDNYGLLFENAKEYDAAIAHYRRSIELQGDRPESHVNLASALEKTGHVDDALAEYEKALELEPELTEALGGRGNLWGRQHDWDRALADYRRVVELKPDYANGRLCLGMALEHTGALDEALVVYRDMVRAGVRVSDAKACEGRCLVAKRDPAGAKAAYEEALALDPKSPVALFGLGLLTSDAGDLEGAVRLYLRSLESGPESAQTHANLSNVFLQLGDVQAALEHGREAVRIDRMVPEGHLNYANALSSLNREEEALAEYRQALAWRNDFALAWNGLAGSLGDLGRLDEAEAAYLEAIRFDPRLGPPHHNLANLYTKLGRTDDALREYGEATRVEPMLAEAWYGMGRRLIDKGLYADAVEPLRRATELGARRRVWRVKSREWMEVAQRRAAMLPLLEDVVAGRVRPKDPRGRTEYALILNSRSRHADALAQYVAAFAESKELEGSLEGHRYNAACLAIAVAGEGAKDAVELRGRALAWLRADLEAWSRVEELRRRTLEDWKRDPDMAVVRERADELPASERDGWKALWAGVDALLAKTPPR